QQGFWIMKLSIPCNYNGQILLFWPIRTDLVAQSTVIWLRGIFLLVLIVQSAAIVSGGGGGRLCGGEFQRV
ncbi:hypothetical protein, partial [Paenibacillus typhae]|uniref:hypothetical protein n=1 Tax=Paenibacillus typhae TaxID=1174501 RepID=UPI001C8D51C4